MGEKLHELEEVVVVGVDAGAPEGGAGPFTSWPYRPLSLGEVMLTSGTHRAVTL